MAIFNDKVKQNIQAAEGGYVNNPRDRGGETNHGIADAADGKRDGMVDFDHDGVGDVKIRDLAFDEAAERIYKPEFWDRMMLGQVNDQRLAEAIMDTAINHGNRGAGRLVQLALGFGGDKVDGKIGPETIRWINRSDPRKLQVQLATQRRIKYHDIVEKDASQQVFLAGWLKRADKFATA